MQTDKERRLKCVDRRLDLGLGFFLLNVDRLPEVVNSYAVI